MILRYKTITLGVNLLHESSVEFYVDRDDYKDFGDKYLDIECVYLDTDIIKKEGWEQSLDDLERRIKYYLDGLTEDEKFSVIEVFTGLSVDIALRLGQTDYDTILDESFDMVWYAIESGKSKHFDNFKIETKTGETLKCKNCKE